MNDLTEQAHAAIQRARNGYDKLTEQAHAAIQRARNGYDKSAVWDFWTWHARKVVDILTEYREMTNGTPFNPDAPPDADFADAFYTREQWDAKVTEIIEAFQSILDLDEQGEDVPQSLVDDAFAKLAACYLALWD